MSVLLFYRNCIEFIELSGLGSWEESSTTSLQTNNLIRKNNNTSKNADWRGNASRTLNYNQIQKSKWTEIIRCYIFDKTLQFRGFNKRCINDHNKGNEIEHGMKMRYNPTKSTKHGQRESKQICTQTLMSLWSSNNANSSNKTNTNNNSNISNNGNISNDSNNTNKSNNDSNMNYIINDTVIDLHVDDLVDNEYKDRIEGTDTNEVKQKCW